MQITIVDRTGYYTELYYVKAPLDVVRESLDNLVRDMDPIALKPLIVASGDMQLFEGAIADKEGCRIVTVKEFEKAVR